MPAARPSLALAAITAIACLAPAVGFSALPSLAPRAARGLLGARMQKQALNPPPGKKKSFMTNLQESIEHIKDGDKFIAERSKEFGPVFSTTLFFQPTVVVGGPEAVAELLAKESAVQESSLPPPLQSIMSDRFLLLMEGEKHIAQKKILNTLLNRGAMEAYVPTIERRVDEYLDGVVAAGQTYLAKDLTNFCLQLFAELFSGTTLTAREERKYVEFNAGLFALSKVSLAYFRAKRAREELQANMQKRFDAVLAQGKLDDPIHTGWRNLYNAFKQAEKNGREFKGDDMGYVTAVMIWGAYIETASLCSSVVVSTMKRPEVVEQTLAECAAAGVAGRTVAPHTLEDYELPYTLGVIRESERIMPPGGGGFRRAVEPLQIAGYDIPIGTVVTPDPRISTMDPRIFPSPDFFEPRRWIGRDPAPTPEPGGEGKKCPFTGTAAKLDRASWFPGGTGQHQCPGIPLAELVVKIFLAKWVGRVQEWEAVTPLEFSGPPIKLPTDSYKVVLRPRL